MTVRKTLLALGTAALMSAPAWVLPGQALSHPFGPPSSTPNNATNPGAEHRSAAANDAIEDKADKGKHPTPSSDRGRSHKCKPHRVAYVAFGTLESWSLTKNPDGTYNGTVTVVVTHTNHHAAGDKSSTPKEYKLENVRLTFGLADTNNDGSVGPDDLAKGDSVKLIGKISSLAKKCSHTGFTPTTSVRHVIFHAPTKAV
jgi:hypothetical protein